MPKRASICRLQPERRRGSIPVRLDIDRHIATITISNPNRRNAWAADFHDQFAGHFATLADSDVRCVVITGDEAGGAFCAGADLKNEKVHRTENVGEFLASLAGPNKSSLALPGAFPKPVLCAVNGYAVGIGASLTFSCDLIVASDRASWRLPQVSLGVLPKYGSIGRLSRWTGRGIAMRMALGFPMDATEAFGCGLAQWLVQHDDLPAKTAEIAERIASYPPLAVQLVKESARGAVDASEQSNALSDLYRFALLEQTQDARDAHDAWRDRRDPEFRGR